MRTARNSGEGDEEDVLGFQCAGTCSSDSEEEYRVSDSDSWHLEK